MKRKNPQQLAAGVVTIFVLAAVVWYIRTPGPASKPQKEDQPEQIIWDMLDAARAGDVRAYLNCFSGELKTRLRQTVEEQGPRAFSQYLRRSQRGVMGVALSDVRRTSGDTVRVRVEYVYRDKNEVQMHRLRRERGRWKIVEVGSTQRIKTLIPYGTEAYPLTVREGESAEGAETPSGGETIPEETTASAAEE
ncbi:MAG TPA: hypothetical protein EYP85_11390 [Armatimonadetes bacterium]|nr:hypothetical protein [Armatimonadota bacterium]